MAVYEIDPEPILDGKHKAEKLIKATNILLRGVGDTPAKARHALKQEKKKYRTAMKQGLHHLYLMPKVVDGNPVTIRSPRMVPYTKPDGSIDLKMDHNQRSPVLVRKQDVYVGVYKEADET